MMGGVIDFILLSSLIPATLFFFVYLRSRWTSTLPGRASMTLTAAIVVVLTIPLWRQLTGGSAADWYRLAAYLAVSAALWFQFIALVIIQRRRKARQAVDTHR